MMGRQPNPPSDAAPFGPERLLAHRLIPIVVIENPDRAARLATALVSAGLPVAEVTLRTPRAMIALEQMAQTKDLFVGAGTITRPEQVAQVHRAGARFVVSPGLDPDIVRRCLELGLAVFPGVATASEVQAAMKLGLTTVKLFPAETIGGLEMISALAGPFPGMRFVPSGGITLQKMPAYLQHPSVAGGWWFMDGARRGDRHRRLGPHRIVDPAGRRGVESGGFVMLTIPRQSADCAFEAVSLGEVMLRLDPGEGRIRTARSFQVYEGGGEYNVTRGLRRCFGLRTAVVTALVDNEIGRLVEDLILQGGVDPSFIRWVPDDGIGRQARNGLNFTERGFGVRGALGCSDRGNTAVSQLTPGSIDWDHLFGGLGVKWFHTGGIFAALSESTAAVALEALQAARRHGTITSYDLNYRPSLWKGIGGPQRAQQVNRELARHVDVMIGNEEDFTAALGFAVPDTDEHLMQLDTANFEKMIETATADFDNFQVVATTLRTVRSATVNDWGAVAWSAESGFVHATHRPALEILDRVGGGDSFASGLVYGLLTGQSLQQAVDIGAAHGALAMTTPGDTSMASLAEVLRLAKGDGARVQR